MRVVKIIKEKTTTILFAILSILFFAAIIVFWGAGIMHSYKRHNTITTIASTALTPFGIAMGIESLFHEEKKQE